MTLKIMMPTTTRKAQREGKVWEAREGSVNSVLSTTCLPPEIVISTLRTVSKHTESLTLRRSLSWSSRATEALRAVTSALESASSSLTRTTSASSSLSRASLLLSWFSRISS
ncbi:hypothetical protein E2C01_034504 [Portunus trituberculatus]|uniref:Uncharacterized protein n=1 Tax=Portunus trituberculatus TaxID=210409 RepID=A0A5B7F6V0_PORTR|nr:hypothetical protein [Portunus trituberculatus]